MDKNWQAQLYNITDNELDHVVWRYMTFPKFINLCSYGALWFCRLQYLVDEYEGRIPNNALQQMRHENEKAKAFFPHHEHQKQIDEWPERNIDDGRSLTSVNCWYIGEEESSEMWREYAKGPEGVAIKSTIRKVRESVYVPKEFSFIGKVKYVDFESHEMSSCEADYHREFLKEKNRFCHEQELRISTLNIKTPACLDKFGRVFDEEDISGTKMNNYDEAGLQVRVDLNNLFDSVVLAPNVQNWFRNLVTHLSLKANFNWNILDSKLKRAIVS